MSTVSRCCLMLVVIIALLAGCSTPTPAPTAVPTEPPTSTPVPPTATPVPTDTPAPTPTATPEPKPAVKNLLIGTRADLSDGQPVPATFAVGVPMLYASVDTTALPPDSRIEWKLTRNGFDLFDEKVRVISGTGTLTYTLFETARNILPGDYRLVVLASNQMQDGHFVVSADQSPPGTTLLFDNFDDNTLGWELSKDSRQVSSIADGQLRVEAIAADEYTSVSASPLDLSDFDYSVTVTPEDGSASGLATIWFRYTPRGGYALNLFPEGAFSVSSGSYSTVESLIDYQRHAAIKRNGSNVVRIVGQGDKFAIYFNDELAGTFTNKKFPSGDFVLSVGSAKQRGVAYLFDNVMLTTPREQVTLLPTATKAPAATAKPAGTPAPTAVKQVASLPLRDAIIKARDAVEAIGGAMDRIYHGSGGEACGPFMSNFLTVANSPTYDVSAQPANVQAAYAQYRQGVEYVPGSKISQIANICLGGGGTIGNLDFNEARQAANTAGGLLTQALASLGQ
jgi:hypothetical protein